MDGKYLCTSARNGLGGGGGGVIVKGIVAEIIVSDKMITKTYFNVTIFRLFFVFVKVTLFSLLLKFNLM
jgi:hypothetical protein